MKLEQINKAMRGSKIGQVFGLRRNLRALTICRPHRSVCKSNASGASEVRAIPGKTDPAPRGWTVLFWAAPSTDALHWHTVKSGQPVLTNGNRLKYDHYTRECLNVGFESRTEQPERRDFKYALTYSYLQNKAWTKQSDWWFGSQLLHFKAETRLPVAVNPLKNVFGFASWQKHVTVASLPDGLVWGRCVI